MNGSSNLDDERFNLFKRLEEGVHVNIERRLEQNQITSKNSKKLTFYTLQMLNFIPTTILLQLSQDIGQKELPLCFKSKSVVVIAEIRNFYDQYNTRDTQYVDEHKINEYLSEISHSFVETLSSTLNKYGGELIQFFGRAMIAIFPNGDQKDICRRAACCALEIQKDSMKFIQEDLKKNDSKYQIQLMIGLGYGDIQVLHVGGILNRIEIFIIGEAYQRALQALRQADANPKNVCVSGEMWTLIQDDFEGKQTTNSQLNMTLFSPQRPQIFNEQLIPVDLNFFFITQTKQNIRPSRDMILLKVKSSEEIIKAVQLQLKYYIPGSYRQLSQLKSNESRYGQHSQQTVIAVAIEYNSKIKSKNQKEMIKLIQSYVQIMQSQVYKMEGSVSKVISYESGFIFIASWGMQFLAHQDDCQRAVFAALNIKKHLTKLQLDSDFDDESFFEPPLRIGIATGDVYQVVVGNFARKEIVGIGETTERAILLLQSAYQNQYKIYVDYATKQHASHAIDFEYVDHLELPQKVLNIPIYQPLVNFNPIKERLKGKLSAKRQAQEIRIYSNPFSIDRNNFYLKNFNEAYGKETQIKLVLEDIEDYMYSSFNTCSWVLAVKGPLGSGKSLFARNLLIKIADNEREILKELYANYPGLHFEYLAASNDADKNMQILGVWRGFLRQLLDIYAQETSQTKENVLNAQLQHVTAINDKIPIIQDIFGLNNLVKIAQNINIGTFDDPINIATERYDEETEEIILFFCFDFVFHVLSYLKQTVVYLLVFDNVETMNYSSWRLFDLVQSQCHNLIMIMNIESENNYFQIPPNESISQLGFQIDSDDLTKKYYKEFIKPKENELFSVVEMTPIKKQSLLYALKELASVYERSMNEEIEDLTRVRSTKGSTKTFEKQKEETVRLISQYQVYQQFNDVEDQVLESVLQQSKGNPMIAFWFTFQTFIQGYVQIESHILKAGQKFLNCIQNHSYSSLQLSFLVMKQMHVFVEKAFKISTKRSPKLSSHMGVQLLQILYSASVIGNIFSQTLLDSASKIVVPPSKMISTLEILKQAEERDLIELIMMDDQSSDMIYRFTNPFLRDALYQMQPYEAQKKEMHYNIIKYMIDKIVLDYTNRWSFDDELLYFVRHLLRFERVQVEDQLSALSRRKLQIKKINHELEKRTEIIKQTTIKLILDGGRTYEDVKCVLSRSLDLKFFFQDRLLVKVELQQIQKIIKMDTVKLTTNIENAVNEAEPLFQFKIFWSEDESNQQKSEMLIVQSVNNQMKSRRECEDWISTIEYLMTKQSFEKFRTDYGNIKFHKHKQLDEDGNTKPKILNSRNYVLSKDLLSRLPQNRTRLQSISLTQFNNTESIQKIKIPKTINKNAEIVLLANRISTLYNISQIQFFNHLGQDASELGKVSSSIREPIINLTKNLMSYSGISDIENSEDVISQQNSLISLNDSNTSMKIRLTSQFDIQGILAAELTQQWEDCRVPKLNVLNAIWKEGAIVKPDVQSNFDETDGYKLQRRWDCQGYNKGVSPYKSFLLQSPIQSKTAIKDTQRLSKSPNKNRKPKAEAIQKILENTNSPWYQNYLNAVKNRPQPEKQATQANQGFGDIEPRFPEIQNQLRKEEVIGGLTQSKSHKSIGQSQIELETLQPIEKRRMTLRSSIQSRQHRQNTIQSSIKSKVGDNILIPQDNPDSQNQLQEATSKIKMTPNPDFHPDQLVQFHNGSPAYLLNEKPQYIVVQQDIKISLKQGDVIYLSEQLTESNVVKCHTWVQGNKVDLIVGRYEIQLIHDSKFALDIQLKRFNANEKSELKKLGSKESLMDHQEQSYNQQQILAQQNSYIRRVSSQGKLPVNQLFKKLQERQVVRLRREMLHKSRPLNELLNSSPKKNTEGQKILDEITPRNIGFEYSSPIKPVLKVTERQRKKLLNQF